MLYSIARTVMSLLPDRAAFQIAILLASLPPKLSLRPEDRRALDAAKRFEFGSGVRRVAWRWGHGPTIVLAHGWGGRAGQMVKMADAIAKAGFEVVVFDSQGHGESDGHRIGFGRMIADLRALDEALHGDIAAWVCHSAAGLCLAASQLCLGQKPQRLVFLATPRGPYIPINELKRHLKPRAGVLDRCGEFYASEFSMQWDDMDQCAAFIDHGDAELLLIQDRDDKRLQANDAERIADAWGNAQILRTDGLGHLKPLWSDDVMQAVIGFLKSNEVPDQEVSEGFAPAAPSQDISN